MGTGPAFRKIGLRVVYRALALLVKQRRLAKTAPVLCVVRDAGTPEEDSLAENVQRAPLHPLDQFRAFLALREKGQFEEIAAAQFVPVAVVKQRLRLASVSPKLLEVYAEDGMTLDQLMAFTVNRLFDLGLGPVALAFTAASSRNDMATIAALHEAHGPDGFAAAWLRHRGLGWAADLLPPSIQPQTMEMSA